MPNQTPNSCSLVKLRLRPKTKTFAGTCILLTDFWEKNMGYSLFTCRFDRPVAPGICCVVVYMYDHVQFVHV